jgi:alkanesulfonate monooxygenase SsuD/methylene tetrahydromethanopterin reductase-like flavin-dependent oxidoreductase (luciferase family)
VRIGIFAVPNAEGADATIELVETADRVGLDVVGIQDHPYQRRYLDTWTLLSFLAARTERITLMPDVMNLPLRLPTVLAKSVASLDVLSDGRVELGIGAGAFWDAVWAMGGPRREPGESVEALEEAMGIIRGFLDVERTLRFDGEHYRVSGARPGPPPAHRVGLWVGAYGPRMLRLTGRLGDGWLPSVGGHYLAVDEIADRHRTIDEAAKRVGRDPAEITRGVNVGLDDPAEMLDPEAIARFADTHRFDLVLVSVPDDGGLDFVRRLGEEVAPVARELVGAG